MIELYLYVPRTKPSQVASVYSIKFNLLLFTETNRKYFMSVV